MFKNWKKRKFYKRLIDKIDEGTWNMELRIITIKDIREGIRRQFDDISGMIKELEQRIEKEILQPKRNQKKLEILVKNKTQCELDAEKMKEQMIGKWSEKEGAYFGGIDQEIKAVQEKIVGGKEFQGFIKRELKKL